jgi:hypothetical protein
VRLSRLRHRATLATLVAALATATASVEAADATVQSDLREGLSEPQQEWWDIEAPTKALLCGRRAGKSTLLAAWLVDGAIGAPPNSLCVYLSQTRAQAETNLWIPIKDAAKRCGTPHKINEAKLTITFEGGGRILLAGTDSKRELEKIRGKAIVRAAVDECGSMRPSDLAYLHRDVLHPACMDHGGELAFAGTPGMTCEGYWYEMTREGSEMGVPCMRWTARENPFIADADAYFAQTLETFGWTTETPTYIREYLGCWVRDIGDLVFPVEKQNFTIELPTHNAKGFLLAPVSWRYVIGVDLGYVDATSFSVVACHPDLPRREFIVQTEKHTKWLPDQVHQRLEDLRREYGAAVVVLDIGGLGKPYSETLKRKGFHHEPAEKTEKAAQVRLVRDSLLSGTLFVLTGEQNKALLDEWSTMGWDTKREKPHPSSEDHASDATIYALRRLRHYSQTEPAPGPSPGSREAVEAEAKRIRDRRIAEIKQQQKGNRWRT